MLDELARGALGVTLALPSRLQVREDTPGTARLDDPERALAYFVFFLPDLRLDLSPAALPSLRRDVTAHAEYLFDAMLRAHPAPRPARHPLVACDVVGIAGGQALVVQHRMLLQPGLELVMGHLLVGTRAGLFELRWLARNVGPTGQRESMLLIDATAGRPELSEAEITAVMRSIDYDAPAHDARFPDSPIARARAAEAWARGAIRVTAPAAPPPSTVGCAGCTLTLPPRFALHGQSAQFSRFARTSLACNDGVQYLVVELTRDDAATLATTVLRAQGEGFEVSELHRPAIVPPVTGFAIADGGTAQDHLRVAAITWQLAERRYAATLTTTPAQPRDAIEAELTALARSARLS